MRKFIMAFGTARKREDERPVRSEGRTVGRARRSRLPSASGLEKCPEPAVLGLEPQPETRRSLAPV